MANPASFPVNKPVNRYKGGLPKIGIRPVIDGRCRGVRESLEDQTMNIARSVKELIEANIRHTNGQPVECVIADGTIGRVAESAACQDKFDREGVGVSITVTPCWCYGAETMDMDPLRPKAVYGFNGTERPGAVYLASVLATYSQKGLPAYGIYGHDVLEADDMTIPEDVKEKLLRFARAGLAVATMRGKSYLSMGSTAMGIGGSMVNTDFLEKYLGMRSESIDMVEFTRRWEEGIYDKDLYEKALAWAKENVRIGFDKNPPEAQHDAARKEWVFETCVKMGLIAEDLMQGNPKLAEMGFPEEALGHNAIAAGFQGQRQWTDHYPNGDYMESLLNSSFDWNGIREPFVIATENDHLNGISMLFGKLLTNSAQGFADVRTYWSPDALKRVTGWTPDGLASGGFIHFINSGAAMLDATGAIKNEQGESVIKPWYELKGEDAAACMDATQYCYADLGYFRGGGYSSQFRTSGVMPMTMIRINIVDGLGPVLQLAEGWSTDIPDDVFDIINKRTDPTWPSTFFVPRLDPSKRQFRDVYSVMNYWGANHCAFCYGHIGADLITLCAMLRIPVCMHNVPDEKIFRPSAWNSFGMDPEGSDYRACANFGPIYGRKH